MNTEPALIHKMTDFLTENALKYSLQFIGGAVILFSAWILSKFVVQFVRRAIKDKHLDITIEKFILQVVRITILGLGIMLALSAIGVQIAPLIAGLSVAGVGVGLALQGPLSNYAAGTTLIFTKPFKVGDIIEVNGFQGEVKDIALPRTELYGLDGSIIVIPNKHIIGEVIKNFSEYRKLEFDIGVSYDSDIPKALKILETIIVSEKRIPSKEKFAVGIKDFGESAVNLQAFTWVAQSDYASVRFAINQAILTEFRNQGIDIPFPQHEVHIRQKSV